MIISGVPSRFFLNLIFFLVALEGQSGVACFRRKQCQEADSSCLLDSVSLCFHSQVALICLYLWGTTGVQASSRTLWLYFALFTSPVGQFPLFLFVNRQVPHVLKTVLNFLLWLSAVWWMELLFLSEKRCLDKLLQLLQCSSSAVMVPSEQGTAKSQDNSLVASYLLWAFFLLWLYYSQL